jgi:hypothetical protein
MKHCEFDTLCVMHQQSEFQRMIRATLELPPATHAELEILNILTRGGRRPLYSTLV